MLNKEVETVQDWILTTVLILGILSVLPCSHVTSPFWLVTHHSQQSMPVCSPETLHTVEYRAKTISHVWFPWFEIGAVTIPFYRSFNTPQTAAIYDRLIFRDITIFKAFIRLSEGENRVKNQPTNHAIKSQFKQENTWQTSLYKM